VYPEWHKLSQNIRNVDLRAIDCEKDRDKLLQFNNILRTKYKQEQITSFPTWYLVKNQELTLYDGERKANDFEQWIMKRKN